MMYKESIYIFVCIDASRFMQYFCSYKNIVLRISFVTQSSIISESDQQTHHINVIVENSDSVTIPDDVFISIRTEFIAAASNATNGMLALRELFKFNFP